MRLHWMNRGSFSTVEEMESLSNELEKYNYHSVLLVYNSTNADNWVKAARVAKNDQKLKYMIAIRTYAISPEYCGMICESFNQMLPGKIMLNVLSGDVMKKETSIDDVVFIENKVSSPEKRLAYTDEWMKKFLNLKIMSEIPEIVMSGHSQKTKEMALKYGATHLSALNMFNQYIKTENPIINPKQMLNFNVIVRDTKEEAEEVLKNVNDGSERSCVYGNKQDIKEYIQGLIDIGISDIIITTNNYDEQHMRVHDTINEIMEEING